MEYDEELASASARRLDELGIENVTIIHGDGTLGAPEHAPFDAVIVSAAARSVPDAPLAQLARGGRMVFPLADSDDAQRLMHIQIADSGATRETDLEMPVRFVPLIGS